MCFHYFKVILTVFCKYVTSLFSLGVNNGRDQILECSMNPQKFNSKASAKEGSRIGLGRLRRDSRRNSGQNFLGEVDTAKKLLHMAWHPEDNVLAVASTNSLFFFNAE